MGTVFGVFSDTLYVGGHEVNTEFDLIDEADMDLIRSKKILFGSRSFGFHLCRGLEILAQKNPLYQLNLINSYSCFSNL